MKWVLLMTLGGTGAVLVALAVLLLLARHRWRRLHRVDPKVATSAPLTWAVDPRSPARLHRRLARIGTTACDVADDHRGRGRRRRTVSGPVVEAADALRTRAVALDHRLARVAALAPAARRAPLAELATAVAELEAAAADLVALSADVRTPRALAAEDTDVTDVRRQLAHLAAAQRELDALDADAGLRGAGVPAPPPPAPTRGTLRRATGGR